MILIEEDFSLTSVPRWFLALRSTPARMYSIPPHRNRTINAVQLVIQPASIAHHLALHISSPDGRRHSATIRTGHFHLLRNVATLLVELLFLFVHL